MRNPVCLLPLLAWAAVAACASPASSRQATFRVATFNIRIDIDRNGKPVDRGENAWPMRLPRVVKVIRDGRFDLIGFQEVTTNMWPDLVAALPGYAFADGPDKNGPNPIAYNPGLFECIDSGRFALSARPDDFNAPTWGSPGVRICQWARLKHRATGRTIRVFCQHQDWKSQESRSKGMALVVEKAKQAISDGEDVIMVGDLNEMVGATVPWSPPDPDRPFGDSVRIAKEALRDSFDAAETPHTGPAFTYHGYKPSATLRLDYIFVSDAFRVLSHHTHADRPDGRFPSDHDAVSALLGLECRRQPEGLARHFCRAAAHNRTLHNAEVAPRQFCLSLRHVEFSTPRRGVFCYNTHIPWVAGGCPPSEAIRETFTMRFAGRKSS